MASALKRWAVSSCIENPYLAPCTQITRGLSRIDDDIAPLMSLRVFATMPLTRDALIPRKHAISGSGTPATRR